MQDGKTLVSSESQTNETTFNSTLNSLCSKREENKTQAYKHESWTMSVCWDI